jgi:hypothetical protein
MKYKSSETDLNVTDVFGDAPSLPKGEDLRQEYELKQLIIQGGVEKPAGTKVKLNSRQADNLRAAGII